MSLVLASILLTATVFAQVNPSQNVSDGDEAVMRRLAQYFNRVGTEQYELGYYIEAKKTFQMAQGYAEYLEPVEQKKLASMLEKSGLAAIERQKVLEQRLAAVQLYQQGDSAAARSHLEAIKDSKFLTEDERVEIQLSLRQLDAASAGSTPDKGDSLRAATPAVEPVVAEKAPEQSTLGRFKNRIAETYYESVKAYHAGDYETARVGFNEVLESGVMPVTMTEDIRGYLADMEGAKSGRKATAEKVSMTEVSASELAQASAADITGMPTAYDAQEGQQGEAARMKQLFDSSWELYSRGELKAAREGFVKVAQSGLYTADPGKRPEDYIETIDRLLASSEATSPAAAQTNLNTANQDQGSFIDVINRRRSIIRSHAQAVVGDAVSQAEGFVAENQFNKARESVDIARRVINENQLHLGDELYNQYNQRLNDMAQRIDKAESAHKAQLAEQKRQEAIKVDEEIREQAEQDRQQRIDEYLKRARAYVKQMRYEAALGQVNAVVKIDPLNDQALTLKDMLEDWVNLREQNEIKKEQNKERVEQFKEVEKSNIPYSDEMTYPKNWDEIAQKRKPEEPIGVDPANMAVYKQLETVVDLTELSQEMPFSEAIEIIRNKVSPPLNIVVYWNDLLDNADISPDSPIGMDGLAQVELGSALENLINAAAGGFAELDYRVNKGVISIATIDSLPEKKMETHVYDVSDLVSAPANYGGMGGMMGGGMMGGMGGGMMGGGMGGMGGGMMGGGMMGGGMMGGGNTSMMSMMMAQSLRQLIQESIDPDSWYELSEEGEGTIMVYPTQSPKKLAIYQSPEVHARIRDLLDQLRKALGEQVSIEARFLAVSENFLEDIGFDLDLSYNFGGKWGVMTAEQGSSVVTSTDVGTGVAGSLGNITTENPALALSGGYGSALDDLQVNFLLRATQARTDSKKLSAPKLTVMSGESASFSLNDMVSYALPPTQTQGLFQNSTGGGTVGQTGTQNNVSFLTVGSNLSITPTISKDKKYVLLNITTTQIDLLGFATHEVTDTTETDTDTDTDTQDTEPLTYQIQVPETETANVMTRVSVPDGGTLLLGGHKISAEIDAQSGVPVLSKIPVLGALFSSRSKVRDHKVLLILVKPTILLQDEREQEVLASLEESGGSSEYRF